MNPANIPGKHYAFTWYTHPYGNQITHRCDMPTGRFVIRLFRNNKFQLRWEGRVIDTQQETIETAKALAEQMYMEGRL